MFAIPSQDLIFRAPSPGGASIYSGGTFGAGVSASAYCIGGEDTVLDGTLYMFWRSLRSIWTRICLEMMFAVFV